MGNMTHGEVVSIAFRAEGDYAVFTFTDGPREYASARCAKPRDGLVRLASPSCWPTETFSGGSVWPSRWQISWTDRPVAFSGVRALPYPHVAP